MKPTTFIASLLCMCATALSLAEIKPQDLVQASNRTLSSDVALNATRAIRCANKQNRIDTLLIADMNLTSNRPRFYAFNVSGKKPVLITRDYIAHGKGSERGLRGIAQRFSNEPNSEATSLGLYQVGEQYNFRGQEDVLARRLNGLMPGWNDNARLRGVVLHGMASARAGGRSLGCPAVDPSIYDKLEGIGLSRAMLWIDGKDDDLSRAVATCTMRKPALKFDIIKESITPFAAELDPVPVSFAFNLSCRSFGAFGRPAVCNSAMA